MDNRRNRFLKIEENIEKCLQFILCALIIITTAVFVLYSSINQAFNANSNITRSVINENYIRNLINDINLNVAKECNNLNISYETVAHSINTTKIQLMSERYFSSQCDALFNGNEIALVEYPDEDFYPALSEISDLNDVQKQEYANKLAQIVTLSVTQPIDTTFSKISFLGSLNSLMSSTLINIVFIIMDIIFIFIFIVSYKRSTLRRFSTVTGLLWMGVSMIFIPGIISKVFDYNTLFTNTSYSLNALGTNMFNHIFDNIISMSCIIWIILTIVLIISVFEIAWRPFKHHHKRKDIIE